jgi:hypothetical protein
MQWSNGRRAKTPRDPSQPLLGDLETRVLSRFRRVSTQKGGFRALNAPVSPKQGWAAMMVRTARAGTTWRIDEVVCDDFLEVRSPGYLGRGRILRNLWERS